MWGLNWGKGTRAGAETGVMDKTGIMRFTLPFRVTTTLAIRRRGNSTMHLVLDEASVVHLGCQITRPLHVPQEQFSHLLRW